MQAETNEKKRPGLDRSLLENVIRRACEGDESMLPAIRMMLDELPNGSRVLGGDLAQEAAQALISAATGKNLVQREALFRKMEELRSELAGPNPQPLERLLIERIVVCWLHAYYADVKYGQAGSVMPEHGDYLQRQQDRAQRRYLAAIKCLHTVRRLALPIKVDVTVAGAVESQPKPACRRTVEADHAVASAS